MEPYSGNAFEFNEVNLQKIKEDYSKEMRDDANNPIKICMKLVFEAAIEKDPTKRIELSNELSKFLIQPRGVLNLFLTVIDFDTSSQKVTTLNQRFIAIANIITCLPKLCVPYKTFCDNITRQLRTFLVSDNTKYSTLASIIVKSMIESPHARGDDISAIILSPTIEAFSKIDEQNSWAPHEAILTTYNLIQNHTPSKLFIRIFSQLFYAFYVLNNTPSRLKGHLKAILVSILNNLEPGPACCLLEGTIFHEQRFNIYQLMAEADEISISIIPKNNPEKEKLIDFDEISLLVMKILESCENKRLVLEFFFYFQSKIWSTTDERQRQRYAKMIEPLLDESTTADNSSDHLDILNCMADSDYALELVYRSLLNYAESFRSQTDSDLNAKDLVRISVSTCLNILEILAANASEPNHIDLLARKVRPTLEDIKYSISMSEQDDNKRLVDKLDQLIDKLYKMSKNCLEQTKETGIDASEYNRLMKDLNDKLVPVRVHALVKFKQLIITNDPYTISMIPRLFELIESSLADQEPYVFLACINLVAEMSVRKTAEILPRLIDLYMNGELDVQQRINVGEVLVRLTKQMNKTTPHYSQQVMNMLLFKGTKDSEELVRMSSLTNIGAICHNLGDSLGRYIVEVLSCVEEKIENDTIDVKISALNLLKSTLSGLDKFTVESIQREMTSIYRLLKKNESKYIGEPALMISNDLALREMNRLAKEMLGVSGERGALNRHEIVKNIRVLSLWDKQ